MYFTIGILRVILNLVQNLDQKTVKLNGSF